MSEEETGQALSNALDILGKEHRKVVESRDEYRRRSRALVKVCHEVAAHLQGVQTSVQWAGLEGAASELEEAIVALRQVK
jgi:hypothetical protein